MPPFTSSPSRLHSPASRPEKQRQRRAWLIASSSLSPLIPQVRTYVRTHARAYHHARKCVRNKMGAGGSGSRGCKWSGCSGGQRPKTPLGYLPLKPEPGLHGHAKGANTHVRTHALPCQGCRSFTAMRRIQYVRTYARTISTADPRMQEFPPVPRPRQGCKRSTA